MMNNPKTWTHFAGLLVAMAGAVVLTAFLVFTTPAHAHLDRDCNDDGAHDIYGVAYSANDLHDAQHEFESRGVAVESIEVIQSGLGCNAARTFAQNAWQGCRCRHFMFSGPWDYSIAGSQPACTVYGIQGEYTRAPVEQGYIDG